MGLNLLIKKKLGAVASRGKLPTTSTFNWNWILQFERVVFERSQKVSKNSQKNKKIIF